jgi:hypothetical protein
MGAVQRLVDEILPVDEMGQQDHTPAILDRIQDVQDAASEILNVPRRPLVPPDSGQ